MIIHNIRTATLAGIIAAALAGPAFAVESQIPSTVPSEEMMQPPEQTVPAEQAMPADQSAAQPIYAPVPVAVSPAPVAVSPAAYTTVAPQAISQHPNAPLQAKQEGDVTYITGGIGDGEVDQMKSESGNYNFQMINSDPTGHYTANMDLVIQSKDGRTMIRVNDAGPLFYAQLPPGEYRIEATHDGRTENKTIRVSAHGAPAKAVMIWR